MTHDPEVLLKRWSEAGLLDAAAAARIRAWEAQQEKSKGLRWPVLLAIAFGCAMVGAGILLFVAAHWENISPAQRFAMVLLMVGGVHLAAALVGEKFPQLSTALHGVGTVAFGAGIFLAGQIFNLQEHWPGGLMLWAIGAWLAWLLLKDWIQATWLALLAPAWLASEWGVRIWGHYHRGYGVVFASLLILAITYLTARRPEDDANPIRRALMWIGGLGLLPLIFCTVLSGWEDKPHNFWISRQVLPTGLLVLGWGFGVLLPLLLAYRLRGKAAWMNAVAASWALVLVWMSGIRDPENNFLAYLWCFIGAIGLIYWGLYEYRKERVNFGMAMFAISLISFYFSSVMDKLGRSTALIGMGLLFLLGGWYMEKMRRKLIARITRIEGGAA